MPTALTNMTIPDMDDFESTDKEGMWQNVIDSLTTCDTAISRAQAKIAVYGSDGTFKANYTTIDLAVAALASGDKIVLQPGTYTLTAACNITKPNISIIGIGEVEIVGAVGADYCFKTVMGALSATAGLTFSNLSITHDDDATQVGIQIDNTSATKKINLYVNDVDFNTDGGNSIDVDHADADNAIRVYVKRGTIEGAVNFSTKNAGDRLRFSKATVRGGVVTSTDDIDLEVLLDHCIVLHQGISGGHANQRIIAINCASETDADPNVYALYDADDNQGNGTDQIIGS